MGEGEGDVAADVEDEVIAPGETADGDRAGQGGVAVKGLNRLSAVLPVEVGDVQSDLMGLTVGQVQGDVECCGVIVLSGDGPAARLLQGSQRVDG